MMRRDNKQMVMPITQKLAPITQQRYEADKQTSVKQNHQDILFP